MSIVAYAVALAAYKALKNASWAGTAVHLEPAEPLKIDVPTVCLYCADLDSPVENHDLAGATANMGLRIEIMIPESVRPPAGTAPSEIAATRSGAFVFAVLRRQIIAALMGATPWAELFRILVFRMSHVTMTADLFQVEAGRKISVRVLLIEFEGVREPDIGVAPTGIFLALLAAMRNDAGDLAAYADILEALIEGAPLPDWASFAASTGLVHGDATRIGLAFEDGQDSFDLGPEAPAGTTTVTIADGSVLVSTDDLAAG